MKLGKGSQTSEYDLHLSKWVICQLFCEKVSFHEQHETPLPQPY